MGRLSRGYWPLAACFFLFCGSQISFATNITGLPLDPSLFPDPSTLISPNIVKSVVKTVGLLTEIRPYEPASPLGFSLGVEIGLVVTLVKVPSDFFAALKEAGLDQSIPQLPALPFPMLIIHKGVHERIDLGLAGLYYKGYQVYGGDVKLVLYQPEEGPTWAARLGYTRAALGFVTTTSWTPQLLVSKKLDFAEPYMGVGYQYILGTIKVTIKPEDPYPAITISGSGFSHEVNAFGGISLRMPLMGFRITMEGGYSSVASHTLGVKIGSSF